jgi:hypothetical protein
MPAVPVQDKQTKQWLSGDKADPKTIAITP